MTIVKVRTRESFLISVRTVVQISRTGLRHQPTRSTVWVLYEEYDDDKMKDPTRT